MLARSRAEINNGNMSVMLVHKSTTLLPLPHISHFLLSYLHSLMIDLPAAAPIPLVRCLAAVHTATAVMAKVTMTPRIWRMQ